MTRKIFQFLTLCSLSLILSACGGDKDSTAQIRLPAEKLYEIALQTRATGDYKATVKAYEEVERQHPRHELAKKSIAGIVEIAYDTVHYDDVILYADSFLSFNPKHALSPKVAYTKALSYYEQIVDVGRDQGNTDDAIQALTDVILRYPNSTYALSARNKIKLATDHIAGKHLDVGRFYLRQNNYQPALARFQVVISEYSQTSQVPEALARTVEAWLALGMYDRAYASGVILGYNHANSPWYKYAYDLLQEYAPKS